MVKNKRQRYRNYRARIEKMANNGALSTAEFNCVLGFLDAKDPECGIVHDPNDRPKSDGTLSSYAYSLKRVAELSNFDLTETTPDEINRFMDAMRRGSIDGVKDGGLSKGSVRNHQTCLRKFYEYHSDLGVIKDEIVVFKNDHSAVDERDIFDKEDITELREAASHPRDRCLIDLLLYSGQRISAILNLRIKDVDPNEGIFYLNKNGNDQKGADGKRPLLYAEKAVRDWLRMHPAKDDPAAHLITYKYDFDSNDYEPGGRLDNSTIYRQLETIGKRAGVDKPVNAHNFRHTFVTICKRDYEMDNDTIKRLIGHSPDSTVMETTYSHLSDDDIIAEAERAIGLRDDEPESSLTPDVCDVCGEPVTLANAKACPSCGIAFTPDAGQVKQQIQRDIGAAEALSDGEVTGEQLKAIANDDAILSKLIELRSQS